MVKRFGVRKEFETRKQKQIRRKKIIGLVIDLVVLVIAVAIIFLWMESRTTNIGSNNLPGIQTGLLISLTPMRVIPNKCKAFDIPR
jgi:uncharacterized membrane protein